MASTSTTPCSAPPNDLFIEDAIEETQVLTSGISAEYGRFTGGVVNAITKSGGNDFSGSFRADFTNPSWRDETPFEEDQRHRARRQAATRFYTATLGGPILQGPAVVLRGAAASTPTRAPGALTTTGIPFTQDEHRRALRGQAHRHHRANHTLHATYRIGAIDRLDRRPVRDIDPVTTSAIDRSAERAVRGQLQRRPHLEPVRRGPVLAEERSAFAQAWRHQHRHQRLARSSLGTSHRTATTTRPTSTPPTPRTATTEQFTASLSYFLHDQPGQPRSQVRLRELHQHPNAAATRSRRPTSCSSTTSWPTKTAARS